MKSTQREKKTRGNDDFDVRAEQKKLIALARLQALAEIDARVLVRSNLIFAYAVLQQIDAVTKAQALELVK